MKKMMLLVVCFTAGYAAKAQCGKTIEWTGSKIEMVDASGKVVATMEEKVKAKTSPTELTLYKNGDDESIGGKINESTCNWAVPYKEGSMVIKARLGDSGRSMDAVVTIEAKEGKLFLWLDMDGRKSRVTLDKYEEKN